MAWLKGRAELGVRHWPSLLSEAHAKAGNVGKGLNIIDEAIAEAEKTRDKVCKAELWRVKGDLLRMQGNSDRKARESFYRAIRIARAQKAKSWELRAVISQSRLMGELGNREAARGMLERIYAQFDEGLETKDLKEANDLLGRFQRTPTRSSPEPPAKRAA